MMILRNLILVFTMLLTFTGGALAETYHNKQFGAVADIPAGFSPMGVEAANSEGMTFRSRGGAIVTVFGVKTSGGFEATVNYWIDRAKSYDGWNIIGKTVTSDWAEFSGKVGGRQLKVRMIAACNGRHALTAKVQFNGNMHSTADKVLRSLKVGSARAC